MIALVLTTNPHLPLPDYQVEGETQSYNLQDNKHWAAAAKDYHQALDQVYYHRHS
jgi:hypothetical protein